MKDWNGNGNSIYKTLGASNHTEKERESNDYYATEPKATELLCEVETFVHPIWECACGQGHMSEVLIEHGYQVYSSDLMDRGYGAQVDFLQTSSKDLPWDIVTNPPYKFAKQFIDKSLEVMADGCKVAMFLKVQFMEGKERKILFTKNPPKTIYVSSSRLMCAKNADFKKMRDGGGSAIAYAWYIWVKGYKGETVIKWIN